MSGWYVYIIDTHKSINLEERGKRMKVVKRLVVGIICAVILICGNRVVVSMAADSTVSPCLDETASASVRLSISNNVASCKVVVVGNSDTASISGTVWLYDETTNETVDSWDVDVNSSTCSESFSTGVVAGHSYTLYFSGTVYSRDGAGEMVNANVSKTN